MIGESQNICCNKCGKYLFSETDTINGTKRKNDNKDYIYNENQNEFYCNDCHRNLTD